MPQECWIFTIGCYPVIHKSLDYRRTDDISAHQLGKESLPPLAGIVWFREEVRDRPTSR